MRLAQPGGDLLHFYRMQSMWFLMVATLIANRRALGRITRMAGISFIRR